MPFNYILPYYLSIPIILKSDCCKKNIFMMELCLFSLSLSHLDAIKKSTVITTPGKIEIIQFDLFITNEKSEA